LSEQLPAFVREPAPSNYMLSGYLVLDFETTNKERGSALDASNSLLLACWRLGREHPGYKAGGILDNIAWGSEFEQSGLLRDCEQASFIVCHQTKFELGWLRRCGLDLRKVLPYCTLIGEKVLHGNIKTQLSLDATAARRGLGQKDATASRLIKAGVCPSQIPRQLLEDYCKQDVALTERIFLQQRVELKELGLLPVAYCRNLVTPVLADIEPRGMCLDAARVEAAHNEYSEQYASLEKEFAAATGGINPKSGKQMREQIYGVLGFQKPTDHKGNELLTDGGKAKTDKATILSLKAETPEQQTFKRLAVELAKLKVPLQNLVKMKAICEANPDDPRMFFTFNQCNTDTDRLSSTSRKGGLQGQNIDRTFKKLFRSREGSSRMCESDGVQLEFRVACHLGRDPAGLADILSGLDVHQVSADYHGSSRQDGKARTFRPLFGGKSGTPRERKYIAYFQQRYNSIYRAQTKWTMDAARDKFIVTESGSRFYFPDAEIKHGGYVQGTTKIFNYPIQQLATGDIIPLVLVLVWHCISVLGDDCHILNTVHDSIVSEVSEKCLVDYKAIIKWAFTDGCLAMLQRLYGIELTVPLGVGMKAGEFWGDGEEEKFDPKPLDSVST
jgi:DNA polymerase I-like protein with 3'-5' exonuclease and polymerase domains